MKTWAWLILFLVLSAPSHAQNREPGLNLNPRVPNEPVRFGEMTPPSPVSGTPSATTRRLASDDPSSFGLYGARFLERSDEPCHVIALFENLRDNGNDENGVWSACGSGENPRSDSNAAVGFGDLSGLDPRAYVTGVDVCINNSKIKGVRFVGMRITKRGRIRPIQPPPVAVGSGTAVAFTPNRTEPAEPLFWRTNCGGASSNKWRGLVTCPSGSAATALIVHHVANPDHATRRQATGLQLECRTVEGIFVSLQ